MACLGRNEVVDVWEGAGKARSRSLGCIALVEAQSQAQRRVIVADYFLVGYHVVGPESIAFGFDS